MMLSRIVTAHFYKCNFINLYFLELIIKMYKLDHYHIKFYLHYTYNCISIYFDNNIPTL